MRRFALVLGVLAAIMLVIAGAPTRAESTGGCDPCPPDCPMMAQSHAAQAAADPASADQDQDQAPAPCKSMAACSADSASAAVLLSEAPAAATLAVTALLLKPGVQLRAPSRPPDRSLRPPIQL